MPDTTPEPHMRCWRLDGAPTSYTLAHGSICRFITGHPPEMTWDPESTDFISLHWTEVPDPRTHVT